MFFKETSADVIICKRFEDRKTFTDDGDKASEGIALLGVEPGPSFTYEQGRTNKVKSDKFPCANYGAITNKRWWHYKRRKAGKEKCGEEESRRADMAKCVVGVVACLLFFMFALLLTQLLPYVLDQYFHYAAVVADGPDCAHVGRKILLKGGSAVDSAIATMLCQCVVHPHVSGLGGGFVMLIYLRRSQTVEALNAVPTPSSQFKYGHKSERDCGRGAESIAVPGTLAGLWEAHQKYGKLPWKILFDAAIEMSIHGVKVSPDLARTLAQYAKSILEDPTLSDIYKNKSTGQVLNAGDTFRNIKLANTLKKAAELGPRVFAPNNLGRNLANDLQSVGGHVTIRDLQDYRALWQKPLSIDIRVHDDRKFWIHTTPSPTDGFRVALIMKLCEGQIRYNEFNQNKIISAFNIAYAVSDYINSEGADKLNNTLQHLLPSDKLLDVMKILSDRLAGADEFKTADNMNSDLEADASAVCIRAPNGDVVAAASTLNSVLGSGIVSKRTGILLNNQMDKYRKSENSSQGNSKSTRLETLSLSPVMVLSDNGDVELVLSGGGGRYTSTDTAYVAINRLFLRQHLRASISELRIHPLPFSDAVVYEQYLKHNGKSKAELSSYYQDAASFKSGVIGIAYDTGRRYVVSSDPRRSGSYDGI